MLTVLVPQVADQVQLVCDLVLHLGRDTSGPAAARAFVGCLPQLARGCVSVRHHLIQQLEACGDRGMLLVREVITRPDGLPHRDGQVERAGGSWHGKIL